MIIVSANLNGIRAAEKKGFFEWMNKQQPDVVCIQETKAQEHQLEQEKHYPKGYHAYFFDAQKKGYSGVAIYSRKKPDKVICGLKKMRRQRREYIICGDWNIVHKEIDIKNFKSNQKNSGCLPEERAWLDDVFEKLGYVDAFRVVHQEPHQYTWWSNRGQSWANNVGWRIDYQVITPGLHDKVKSTSIYKDERFSDHAPLIVEYKGKL
jgi:exodeoxyribonuclease-3